MPDVDPLGPVFISYRQSDGTPYAVALAWALRAAGVPVWHDRSDLPPGDTSRRLDEALTTGLSGAVLIVTPDIAKSQVVRTIELPALLRLERNPTFTLTIGSIVTRDDDPGELDYDAPDRLLAPVDDGLRRLTQYPVAVPTQQVAIAHWHARRRIEALRPHVESRGGRLTLDIQTRVRPAPTDADLTLRLRPPRSGQRRPHPDGLGDLRDALTHLPQLLALAGAGSLRVRGGAHLSAAFALGAAVPSTLIGSVEVIDQYQQVWTGGGRAPLGDERLLTGEPQPDTAGADAVLVYLDLVPAGNDRPYDDFRQARQGQFAAVLHLRAASGDYLPAADAQRIVGEADLAIRRVAAAHGAANVHLLLNTPFPIALLLGRHANTLRVHLYEIEDERAGDGSETPKHYLPSMVVHSGAGGSPVEQITAGR